MLEIICFAVRLSHTFAWVFLLAATATLVPSSSASTQPLPRLSEEAQVSLITVLPGDELYSLFGHSAFRVYDPVLGIDVAFNYGTFDFRDPLSFALRFARGKLDYMLSTQSYPESVYAYSQYERRPIIEQVLNLTPRQVQQVYQYLYVNALPENRTYRYDFLFDNCSTRLRDVLNDTLGEEVRFSPMPDPNKSFRQLLDPYVADRPFLDLGFDLVLGLRIDQIATPREATFLPDFLMESFEHATVRMNGTTEPLVARTDTVYWPPEGARPGQEPPWAAILFWALFAPGVLLTFLELRTPRSASRIFDTVLFGLVGLAGLIMVIMWFLTEHTVTANNLNLLWAWPTHLIVAIWLWQRKEAPWLRGYLLLTAGANVLVVALWWAWPQDLHPATIPIILLFALRSGWRYVQSRQRALA